MKRVSRVLWLALALLAPSILSAQLLSDKKIMTATGVISQDRIRPGDRFEAAVIARIQEGYHVNSSDPADDIYIPTKLEVENSADFTPGAVAYPMAEFKSFSFSQKQLAVYEGEVVMRFPVQAGESLAPGSKTLTATLSYQACDDKSCFAPDSVKVSIPVTVVGKGEIVAPAHQDIFAAASAGSAGPPSSGGPDTDLGKSVREKGLFLTFLLIFLGGLGLNLTPCVYPLIPITVAYFGGQATQGEGQVKTSRTFLLAVFYVLGMSVTYSALGVIAALTGGLFGAALQSTPVILFIAAVMVALAMSMFGFYEITIPAALTGRIRSQQGYIGALSMGLVVGLVAAPCIGPFVLGLLTYVSQMQNPWLGFWMFFMLSLGLGLPFLVLGTFSGGIRALPRSGAWMVWVRSIFGVVLLGMALYFLKPLLPKTIYPILMSLLVVVSAVYVGWLEKSGSELRKFAATKRIVGILGILAGIGLLVSSQMNARATAGSDWKPYEESLLAQAQAQKQPVIIDFTADWCAACHELEAKTFPDSTVRQEGGRFLLLRADLTKTGSTEVEALRKKYDVKGLPTIIFMDASGRELKEQRVTGFVPPEDFLKRMKSAS
ncbi:MAG: protein-disulfide reductase DsbD [Armatimonadetes bacterium]|nr:protein-disulfide reductase DsbD [Armatimonadota bacterium]